MNPTFKSGVKGNDFFDLEGLLKNWQQRSLAGRAQELPFPDNSFDYELALYSAPYYLPVTFEEYDKHKISKEEYRKVILETLRTLKSGGKAHFFPIFQHQYDVSREIMEKLLDICIYELVRVDVPILPLEEEGAYRLVLTKK